jgi:MFS family permease
VLAAGDASLGVRVQVPRAAAVYLGIVQFFFALTWMVYVTFLPQLLDPYGIERSTLIWLLIGDQLVFAIADVATGISVDRVGRTIGRLGPLIAAITAISCLAFLLLPQVALAGAIGGPALFLGITALWAASSSALRAPAWVLLFKYAAVPSVPWLSALSIAGLALASIATPYLVTVLRHQDPRLPFALASASLLATVAGLIWVERAILNQQRISDTAAVTSASSSGLTREARALAEAPPSLFTLFLCSGALLFVGFQAHIAFNSAGQYLRFVEPDQLDWLFPIFWVGFNILIFPAMIVSERSGALPVMIWSALVGSVGAVIAALAPSLELTILGQVICGAGWGGVLMAGFTGALALGREGREGLSLGLWFSIQAIAALTRMGLVAAQLNRSSDFVALTTWVPPGLWVLSTALLTVLIVFTVRRTEAAPSMGSMA